MLILRVGQGACGLGEGLRFMNNSTPPLIVILQLTHLDLDLLAHKLSHTPN